MDIPVELRRKMIMALIEALKESSSFGNIQIAQLKEAVLSSENRTYMQSKSREEYLYFINEKLKKIKNTSGQRFEFRSGNSVKGNYPDEPLDRGYGEAVGPEPSGGRGFGKVPSSPFNMISIPSSYAGGASPLNGQHAYQGNKGQFAPLNSPPYQNGYMEGSQRGTPQMGSYPAYQGGSPMTPRAGGPSVHCSGSGSPILYCGMNNTANVPGKRNDMSVSHQAQMAAAMGSGGQGKARVDFMSGSPQYMRPSPIGSGYSSQAFRGESQIANKAKGSAEPRGGEFSTNRSYIGNVGNRLYIESGHDGRKMFQNGYPEVVSNEKRPPHGAQPKPTGGLFYGYNAERGGQRQSPPVAFQNAFAHGDSRAYDTANAKSFSHEFNRQDGGQRSSYMKSGGGQYAQGIRSSPGNAPDMRGGTDEDAFKALSQDFFKPDTLFGHRREEKQPEQPGSSAEQGRGGADRMPKHDKIANLQRAEAAKSIAGDYVRPQDPPYNDAKHKDLAAVSSQEQAHNFAESLVSERHGPDKQKSEFTTSVPRPQSYSGAPRSEHAVHSREAKSDHRQLPSELESYLIAHSLKLLNIKDADDWKKKLRAALAGFSPSDNSDHKHMVAMQCKYSDYPFIEMSLLSVLLERPAKEPINDFDYSEYFERSVNAFEAVRAINKDSVFQLSSDENE